jgi:hypothetical protein
LYSIVYKVLMPLTAEGLGANSPFPHPHIVLFNDALWFSIVG